MFGTIEAFDDYMKNRYRMFHTFIEYDGIPILYVLTNRDSMLGDDFYLCDCVEFRNKQIILMTHVSREVLEDLINGTITVYEVLNKRGSGLISIVTRGTGTTIENADPHKVPMPSKDSFLSVSKEEKKKLLEKLDRKTVKFI